MDDAHQAGAPYDAYPAGEWTPPTWEEVVRTHSARVYRLAYRLTGTRCAPANAPASRNASTCSHAAATPAAGLLATRSTSSSGISMSGIEARSLVAMAALARRHKAWILIGSIGVKSADGRIYNRGYMLSPDGAIAARLDAVRRRML